MQFSQAPLQRVQQFESEFWNTSYLTIASFDLLYPVQLAPETLQ